MTSLAYGLNMPYEVQLEHSSTISPTHMAVREPQRSPLQPATRHLLTPGVYMVSLAYNGSQSVTLQHVGGGVTNAVTVPAGTAGAPRTSAPIKISVQGTTEHLIVAASASIGGTARATISVIPTSTFDEMAESVQGVSVLSDLSNLKTTLDARVPADTSLRLDTSVGTRVFAGDTMIYGDTGRFQIISNEEWTSNRLALSRTGNVVEIEGRLNPAEAIVGRNRSELVPLADIPAGFRPQTTSGSLYPAGQAYILLGQGVGELGTLLFAEGRGLSVRMDPSASGSWATGHHLLVHAMWRTPDRWPTVLP